MLYHGGHGGSRRSRHDQRIFCELGSCPCFCGRAFHLLWRSGRLMKTLATAVLLMMAIEFRLMSAQPLPPVAAVKTNIQYVDAKPILETLRENLLPSELRVMTRAERELAWPAWVSRHDSTIRARLERGD